MILDYLAHLPSYQKDRVALEAEEKKKKIAHNRDEFHALLIEAVTTFKVTFNEFQDKHRRDPRLTVSKIHGSIFMTLY